MWDHRRMVREINISGEGGSLAAKERGWPLEAEKKKGKELPQKPPEGNAVPLTPPS